MDFKFKGRTWAGNIYHRFETMCQEVDDFVTKDSVKYVENQVQTVGDSMKKLYSNVVHDFLPPVVDNKPNEGQHVTKKQNDDLGAPVRSMVGINEKHGHVCEKESFMEKDNANERGHQQQAENKLYSEDLCNIFTSKNGVVQKEEFSASRFSCSQDEKSSLNLREQHPLPENLDSPVDENSMGAIEISDNGDRKCVSLTKYPPEKSGEDLGCRTSQNDETVCNGDGLSAEAETVSSLERLDVKVFYDDAKMDSEENATNKLHHVSEVANTVKGKDSSELTTCTEEQHQMADVLGLLQDDKSFGQSSASEDFKSNMRGEISSMMLLHDTRSSVVQAEGNVCDNADVSEEAEANLSSEIPDDAAKLGFSLEENVVKDMPFLVECQSLSDDKSCAKLSLCSRDQRPLFEDLSNLEIEEFSESSLILTSENPAKLPAATSVYNQEVRSFQDDGNLCDTADPFKEAGKDLSQKTDVDGICISSDLAGMENCMLLEYSVEESINPPESSPDLSLCSINVLLPAGGLGFLEDDTEFKNSPSLRDKDLKHTGLTNFSQAKSVDGAELRTYPPGETICSPISSSELLSSNICVENKAIVTSLNSYVSKDSSTLPGISHAICTQKVERGSNNYIDSSSCASYISCTSSESFSDIPYDEKAVNHIPAFSSRAVLAVSCEHRDDSVVDVADPDMETIDLSDKVNLDDSCIIVDNRLHFSASSRPRKFRSYKKLIQDAFASRKRRIKEYEQLAIWYGDIEGETCAAPKQNLFPPAIATNSSPRTSQTSDMCELEWELL